MSNQALLLAREQLFQGGRASILLSSCRAIWDTTSHADDVGNRLEEDRMAVVGLQGQYEIDDDPTTTTTIPSSTRRNNCHFSLRHVYIAEDQPCPRYSVQVVSSGVVSNTALPQDARAHNVQARQFVSNTWTKSQSMAEYQSAVKASTDAFLEGGIYELVQALAGPFVYIKTEDI